jgi:hypothetical protein
MKCKSNIMMKTCSYCKCDFGCIVGNVHKTCTTCDVTYDSPECYKSFANETSHGICNLECFLTDLRIKSPKFAKKLEDVLR